jgi:hypothetical protein
MELDELHQTFAGMVPAPVRITRPEGFVYRYAEKTPQQFSVVKLARVLSGIRAAHLLIENGFLQEATVIQRGVDEASEDILFVVYAHTKGEFTKDHIAFLRRFWAEQASAGGHLQRPKIRDYITTTEAELGLGEAGVILQPMKQIYGLYSNYTHATSACVMEMYDGRPPKWQLKGNLKSAFMHDHQFDIRNQYFRGTTAFAFSALLFDRPLLLQKAMSLAQGFMDATRGED